MLTRRTVVADSEVRGHAVASVCQTLAAAVDSSTANLGGTLPHDLREVTPCVEVGHVGACLAVKVVVVADLTVVEQIGNDSGDVCGLDTGGDVLAVVSTVSGAAQIC